MASGFTTTQRNAVLDAYFQTPGATIYGALFTADPGDAGVTTNEIADLYAYARTAITAASAAAAGVIANTAALTFPAASGGVWGLVSYLGVATTSVHAATTLIASGALAVAKQIDDLDQLSFAIGNLTVSIAAQA